MNKSDLSYKLQARFPKLSADEIEKLINKLINNIADNLADDNRIELRGFGSFSLRERESHEARNPKNGEIVQVESRRSIYFRAGKELREKINK